MVGKTHTINLGRSKNKISRIVGTSFSPKQKMNLSSLLLQRRNLYRFCSRNLFIILNSLIKTMQHHNSMAVLIQQTNKNDDVTLSFMIGLKTVCSGSKQNWY